MGTNNIEEIYVTYSKQIYKYLFCLTWDDSLSEELTQETFFIAMKNINKFKSGFTTDELEKEYEELIKDNSIVSNIKIENNKLIYSLNTFNGKSTEEVKDHIYKVYSSSNIFEY